MANAESSYQNSKGLELKLFLDIDLKSEKIQDFYYKGSLSSIYKDELENLKSLVLNHSFTQAQNIKREQLQSEVLLPNGKRPLASISLWLLHQAIDQYLGVVNLHFEKDLLCFCFGVTKSDLQKQVLSRPDFDLKTVISETMATSACGSCREQIIITMKDLREEHGLIQGLTHSQTKLDKEGRWIKIKGMYPAELLIHLDQLKNQWIDREGIRDQFTIEILNIEGHHLWLTITSINMPEDRERHEKVLMSLADFWKSETAALFFLHLAL